MAAGGASGGGGSEGVKAGRAYVEVTTNDAGLKAGLAAAKRAVLSVGKQLTGAGAAAVGAGAAIVGPIGAAFKEAVEHYGKFQDLADRTGASAEDLSALGYAAEQSDASLEDVASGAKFLQKTLAAAGEGSDEAREALDKLGLKAEDLKGKTLAEQFDAVADGMKAIEDPAGRTAAALSVLGRGGLSLLPMFKDGAAGLRAMRDEAESVGAIVGGEDAANAERVGDAINRSWTAVKNTFRSVGAALLPQVETIDRFSTMFTGAVREVKRFVDENRAAVLSVLGVGAAIAAGGAALMGLGLALTAATVAVSGLVAAAGAVGSVLAVVFSPVGLGVAAGVVAALVAVAALLEAFPETFAEIADVGGKTWGFLSDTFLTAWQGIKDALAGGDLKLAFTIAVDALDVVWKAFVLTMTIAWNEFKGSFVDGWHEIARDVGKVWDAVVSEIAAQLAGVIATAYEWAGEDEDAAEFRNRKAAIREAAELDAKLADKRFEQEQRARDAARRDSAATAAAELATARAKLAADTARAAELARGAPVEAGPMPREVAKRLAVEGLGAVRGQMGGYGAGFALAVSGEAIAKKQLTELQKIRENTEDMGGLDVA